MNIGTIIDAAAAGDPDRAALIIDGRIISYGELAAAVEQCAARLADSGLADERVAVVDVGSLLSIATMLGAARIGAAAALMNPALTPPELRGLAKNAECATVGVAGEAYVDRLLEAGLSKAFTVADLLNDGEKSAPPPAEDVDDRDALILFTSGTTGLPKAIAITQGQLNARITGVATPFRADAPPTVSMMSVPFFHVGGAIGVLGNLYAGNTYVVQARFDAGEWLRLVQEHRVTSTFMVPTMLQRILDHPDFDSTDLTSLTAIAYGAAAAPVALVQRAMAALPDVAFANVFGQTETLGAYTTLLPGDHRDPKRVASVGRPLPGVEVRVVDPDTGIDVEAGSVGELWVNTTSTSAKAGCERRSRSPRLRRLHLSERPAQGHHQPRGREVRTDRGRGRHSDPSGSE